MRARRMIATTPIRIPANQAFRTDCCCDLLLKTRPMCLNPKVVILSEREEPALRHAEGICPVRRQGRASR